MRTGNLGMIKEERTDCTERVYYWNIHDTEPSETLNIISIQLV